MVTHTDRVVIGSRCQQSECSSNDRLKLDSSCCNDRIEATEKYFATIQRLQRLLRLVSRLCRFVRRSFRTPWGRLAVAGR